MSASPAKRAAPGRLLALALAAVLALAGCGSDDPRRVERDEKRPIKLTIGNSAPLSGELEEFGPDAKRAARLALQRISKAIDEAGARDEVELVTADNGSDPARANATARQLIADGASCIVGPWGGAETLSAARSVAVPKRVALISPAATLDALTGLTDSGLVSRTAPPDSVQGPALASAIAADLGGAKGATVNVGARDDGYGEALANAFIAAWKRAGGRIGEWVTYDVDRESPGAIAKRLGGGDPDATVVIDFPASFARLAPALAATPGYDSASTWAADLLASTELPGQVPDAAIEGLRGTLPAAPDGAPPNVAFRDLFAAGGAGEAGPFAEQTFDAVLVCYLAAVAADSAAGLDLGALVPAVTAPPGEKLTWQELPRAIGALEDGKEIDLTGASGPLDLDVHGDPTAVTYDIYEFSGSEVLLVDQVSIGG